MVLMHANVTEHIIGAFYAVYDQLGAGFLEAVYKKALVIELQEAGIAASSEARVDIAYRGRNVGHYIADLLVEQSVIAEVKAARALTDDHRAQVMNYLRATNIEVGLLLNFGPKPTFERVVYSRHRKHPHTSDDA
jgi:GxxExxY protein